MKACLHSHLHECMHERMHAFMHACIHACMHACMHSCMHAFMHACIHACMNASIHAGMNAHMPSYTHRRLSPPIAKNPPIPWFSKESKKFNDFPKNPICSTSPQKFIISLDFQKILLFTFFHISWFASQANDISGEYHPPRILSTKNDILQECHTRQVLGPAECA